MKPSLRSVSFVVAAAAVWLQAAVAAAQPAEHMPHRGMMRERMGGGGPMAPDMSMRGAVREGMRAEMPGERHGHGRMTPDERRQLRRDIHDAGRDLYAGRERLPRQ